MLRSPVIHEDLRPVRLPEFGNMEISWATCSNPMCENFGLLYGAEDEPGDDASRYRVSVKEPRELMCRGCGQSPKLHAPLSIRPLARHFLSESLPFADCPREECANHGINVFEYKGKRHGRWRSPYRQVNAHRFSCRECESSGEFAPGFSIGTARYWRDNRSERKAIGKQIVHVREGDSVTRARGEGQNVGTYYRRLFRMAERVRDYTAYRNAFLLSPEFRRQQTSAVKVYTDVMEVSLHRVGDGPRHKLLNVIVSVVNLRPYRTHFIVAAHPYFLPASKCPDLDALEEDKERTKFLKRRWEGLETILDEGDLIKDGKIVENPPAQGHAGYILKSPYAEVAHFLTVDRMLSGFPCRHYYMDGDKVQYQSALVAMRRQIRNKSVEIALFQHDKEAGSEADDDGQERPRRKRRRDKPGALRAFKAMEGRFRQRVKGGALRLGKKADAMRRADVWRAAYLGAYSTRGGWAWLQFPTNLVQYRRCRTLWLTRRPGEGIHEGLDLLLDATLQPVDANMGYMRWRTHSADRAGMAAKRRSYVENAYDPRVLRAELSIYLFLRNYHKRPGVPSKHVRAQRMGLIPRERPVMSADKVVWSFRLGAAHAREITRWLKRQ